MITIEECYSLMSYNTFGIQSYATLFARAQNVEELKDIIDKYSEDHRPKLILGGGSNLLFLQDFNGIVIMPDIHGIELIKQTPDHVWVRAFAGENWDSFVEYCVSKNLGGIENLSLIPGNVGACPIQNIGAYGVEVKDVIDSVEAIEIQTGKSKTFTNSECRFGYRESIFKKEAKQKFIITSVIFKLALSPILKTSYKDVEEELISLGEKNISTVRQAIINIRKRKLPDPEQYGNAGSFFKNPVITREKFEAIKHEFPEIPSYPADFGLVKISAAWLIQTCGWKGKREGNVGSFPTQPLVIVNYGGATGKEVFTFASRIQESVKQNFDIELEMEVNVI